MVHRLVHHAAPHEAYYKSRRARLSRLCSFQDGRGATPLHHATKHGQVGCMRALAELGADVRARDAAGDTALHVAATQGQLEPMRVLMQMGADSLAANRQGRTPVDHAAGNGQACTHAPVARDSA